MFEVIDHWLCVEDSETETMVQICQEITIIQKKCDLMSGVMKLVVGIWLKDGLHQFEMDRKELTGTKYLSTFVEHGLSILSTDRKITQALLGFLLELDVSMDITYTHQQLGFWTVQEKLVFLGDSLIGDSMKSHYIYPEATAPKGCLENWKKLVTEEVMGYPPLELALAIGFSIPIAHILRSYNVYAENPVWDIVGRSSTGKTTALRLIASIFGSPKEGALVKDWNTSDPYFFKSLSQSTGYPNIIDESTANPNVDANSAIYMLSKGLEKGKCLSSGDMRERQQFSGPIIISGETSLLKNGAANLGVYARTVELTLAWTKDAAHARRLCDGLGEAYGTAVVPFVETLLKVLRKNPQNFKKSFSHELNTFKKAIGEVNGEEERQLNMYSTVILSAKLAKRVLGLDFHIKEITNLFIQVHRSMPKRRDIAKELYDAVMRQINENRYRFPKTSKGMGICSTSMACWGEWSSRDGKEVVWISKKKFEEFSRAEKFENYQDYLSQLAEDRLLVSFEERHYTTRHKLNNSTCRCYCLIKE